MLRQRRGVLAVDHVDRLEEPKEHVHIHRVVRQGLLQGTLSFIGMLLPLLSFRALLLPEHLWTVLPMAARSAAGPVGALTWKSAALESRAPGRQRWFIYSLRTVLAATGELISLSCLTCNTVLHVKAIKPSSRESPSTVFHRVCVGIWPMHRCEACAMAGMTYPADAIMCSNNLHDTDGP